MDEALDATPDEATRRARWRGVSWARLTCWLAGLGVFAMSSWQLLLLAYVVAKRVSFPFDLEWMEGGMLCHSLRFMEGKHIYVEPSAEFIPYLYTPLYPAVVAGLAKVFGLGYGLARGVSILSFATLLVLVVVIVRREAKERSLVWLWALAPAGLIASGFPFAGAWYDLVRSDSLCMTLMLMGLYLLRYGPSQRQLVAAGVLMGLAFLAKQTAAVFVVMTGFYVLVTQPRRLLLYVCSVGVVAGGVSLALNHATDGWYWRYIFEMHQGHEFHRERMWPQTQLELLRYFPLAASAFLGLGAFAAVQVARGKGTKHQRHSLVYWFVVALTGILAAATGWSTQWSAYNAFIPGIIFPAIFIGVATVQLVDMGLQSKAQKEVVPATALAAGVACLLVVQLGRSLYDPEPHIPSQSSREAGERLIDLLRSFEGEVLIPVHPYYAVLAGKRPGYQDMGVADVVKAGYPFPADLRERLQGRYYDALIFDYQPGAPYPERAFRGGAYRLARKLRATESPTVVTGSGHRPRYLYLPTGSPR